MTVAVDVNQRSTTTTRDNGNVRAQPSVAAELPWFTPTTSTRIDQLAFEAHAADLVAAHLGLGRRERRAPCPLHEGAHPASVEVDPRTGAWSFCCWRRPTNPYRRGFGRLRAELSGRPDTTPSAAEQVVWYRRLFYEAGALGELPALRAAPPAQPAPKETATFEGFLLLLRLWALSNPGEPVMFSRRFAAVWCGISESAAQRATAALLREGVIERVDAVRGHRRATPRYRPVMDGAR